jgi:tetratricopeptide (TPR) repeat protein
MAYRNLGNAYQSLRDFNKAIEYHTKHSKICIEIGDQDGEGEAYRTLGCVYESLGYFNKAIEYCTKHLNICKDIGDRSRERDA